MPNAKVYAIDVSEKALQPKNAVINQVDVTFIEQNILETADLNQQFDIIVSNPYVRNLEKQEIKKNVLDNEPHLFFFCDEDALIFI
jgi:release factor glutamine methyltransferase